MWSMSGKRRRVSRAFSRPLTLGAVAAFAACDRPATAPELPLTGSTATDPVHGGDPLPSRYVLPGSSVFPEGIAYDERTQFVFVSSTTDGTIFRGRSSDETLKEFLPGGTDGRTTAIGLEVDDFGHLFVAGGATGLVFVYDAHTGALISRLSGGSSPTFINDIAIDKHGIGYVTDSQSPVIYRVLPTSAGGYTLDRWLVLTGTPLVYLPGFNLNGIVVSSDGEYLFTIQSNTGKVFRIEIATKEIEEVEVRGGGPFPNGDGLWLEGNSLYVLQNQQETINEIRLETHHALGTLVSRTTDPSFMYPTSLVGVGGKFLVVNSQFDKRAPGASPVLPFTVSVVPVP